MNEIVRNRNLSKFYGRERDLGDLNFAIGRIGRRELRRAS
jgi:hypothetical protein